MHTSSLPRDPKRDDPEIGVSEIGTQHVLPGSAVRNARLIALLDSFDDSSPDQQRHDFDALRTGLEAARPCQRRLFSEGFNP